MVIYYFAYASNMAPEVMTALCPRHRCIGVACLDGYRLAFTRRSVRTGSGVADIVPASGQSVWGVLYEISDAELAAIDRKEGYNWAYTRVMLPVQLGAGGEERTVLTYTVVNKEPTEIPPSRQYLGKIAEAAVERRLPARYIEQLKGIPTVD